MRLGSQELRSSFGVRLIGCGCLALSVLLALASCQNKTPALANPATPQPRDHFLGTWKLNKEKSPPFTWPSGAPRYNPMPVYESIVISWNGDDYTLAFSHDSAKPGESDRVVLGDKTRCIGIDAVDGKLLTYSTYVRRIDADRFIHGSGISEDQYQVLPDQKTMKVLQQPFIDNGFERQLVYDKVPDADVEPFPRF